MEELTLKKFEEAAEKVKEATLQLTLYSANISAIRQAIKYILSLRICSILVLTR